MKENGWFWISAYTAYLPLNFKDRHDSLLGLVDTRFLHHYIDNEFG
jgi:hypothetical protein